MASFTNAADVIASAVEIERRGFAFYEQAAETSKQPEDKEFFTFMAKEEKRHEKVFEAMLKRVGGLALPAGSDEAEYMDYVQALLDSHALFCGGAPEKDLADAADAEAAIELASRFEKDTILYFREMMDLLPPSETDAVKRCLEEERGHLRQLRSMLAKLRQAR